MMICLRPNQNLLSLLAVSPVTVIDRPSINAFVVACVRRS
jgi:hypothetical protein